MKATDSAYNVLLPVRKRSSTKSSMPAVRAYCTAESAENGRPLLRTSWGRKSASNTGPVVCRRACFSTLCNSPDVSRPGVAHKQIQGLGRDLADTLPQLAVEPREEVLDQQRQVLAPLAQGRQLDGETVEPIVEIGAEPARRATTASGRGGWRR